MSRFLNIAIVLAAIGIVSVPVLRNQFATEVARWYLADAANRVAAGEDIEPQLTQAEYWSGDAASLRDYWLLRAEQALASSPTDVEKVIKQAVARDKLNFSIGYNMAIRLSQNSYFKEAVAVLEAACIDNMREEPLLLNQLAYYRALAASDLDQALRDINLALKDAQDVAALRDTRAWVLFQMGKPQEAIHDADFAVNAYDNVNPEGLYGEALNWLEERLAGPSEPRSEDGILTDREAGEVLWGRGVVHYHRAKILEALGRSDEAEAEFQWLRDHKLPTDDRAF